MLPAESQDLAVQRYYEFVKFYQLAGLYQVQFLQLGSFAKLQAALGYEPGHHLDQGGAAELPLGLYPVQGRLLPPGRGQPFSDAGGRAAGVASGESLLRPQDHDGLGAHQEHRGGLAGHSAFGAGGAGVHQHRASHAGEGRHPLPKFSTASPHHLNIAFVPTPPIRRKQLDTCPSTPGGNIWRRPWGIGSAW